MHKVSTIQVQKNQRALQSAQKVLEFFQLQEHKKKGPKSERHNK